MIEELSLTLPQSEVAGSSAEIAVLVEVYSAVLFRVAYALLRNRSEAEDAVQDVFLRVLEHRRSLADVRDVRVWLIRIAWNLALDRRRRIRPEQTAESFFESLAWTGTPADVVLGDSEEMGLVLRAMDRLPAAERQVLLLSAMDELSTAEIAGVMGKSESGVRALQFRARGRLRERLAAKGGVR